MHILVDEREGQRRGGSDAAWQGLRRHRCDHDRRLDPGAVAMAAGVFEPHILQDLCLDLDMELPGNGLAHAMHLTVAARAGLLIVGKVIFKTLARQVFRQGPAATLLSRRALGRRQTCIRKIDDVAVVTVILISGLFGLVEDAIDVLLAAGAKRWSLASASSSSSLTTRCEWASF